MRLAAALLVALACPATAAADHGATYQGEYSNSMLVGTASDGRAVAVMAGVHDDFPYHHPGSDYDQIAVWVQGEKPLVVTQRPQLDGLKLELRERAARFAYAGGGVELSVRLRAVRHTPRYYGDPGEIGDLFISLGYEPSEDAPGLIYTPYELRRLVRGELSLRGEKVELRSLHGQAEAGQINAPTDPRFRSAYNYLAAPTLGGSTEYTFMGFDVHALHSGSEGMFDPYFRETGSDQFTLEGGELASGNPHEVPSPFDNTERLPEGARRVGRWSVDLGPGVLHRAFVRVRSGSGDELLALSETIKEDRRD